MKQQFRRARQLLASLQRLATQMVQGSLVSLKGPCGKASCVCARRRDRYHVRHYLSWTESGRTRMLYLSQSQLQAFQGGVQAWVEFKRLAQQLARLNAQILKSREVKTL